VRPWLELIVYSNAPLDLQVEPEGDVEARRLDPPPRPDGEEVVFHNDVPGLMDRISAAPYALGLRFRPAADGLDDALALAARLLEGLAARAVAAQLGAESDEAITLDVVDVLCLDGRPIDQAIERLRSTEAQARLWMRARSVGDRFDVETYGLRRLGQREVLVPGVEEGKLALVSRFVNQFAAYLAAPGAVITPGDAASFGWVDVRLRAAEQLSGYPDEPWRSAPAYARDSVAAFSAGSEQGLPGLLVVFEPQEAGPAAPYVAGASRALDLVEQLVASAHQCGFTSGVEVPRGAHTAIVCTRFEEGPPVDIRRVPPDERCSSGWVGMCCHPDHDHESASSFREVTLDQLIQWVPRLFPMLAAPAGTGLSVGVDGELTIEPPEKAAL